MKNMELTIKHCEKAMSQEIIIGTGITKTGKFKEFAFSVWDNKYIIYINGYEVDCGQAVEELLNQYNDL